MATISIQLSEEEKQIISDFAKKQNITISELLLGSVFARMEDTEDYLLGVERS